MLMTPERPQLSRSEREDYVTKKNTKIILWALRGGAHSGRWIVLSLEYGVYGRNRYLTMAKRVHRTVSFFSLFLSFTLVQTTKKRSIVIPFFFSIRPFYYSFLAFKETLQGLYIADYMQRYSFFFFFKKEHFKISFLD